MPCWPHRINRPGPADAIRRSSWSRCRPDCGYRTSPVSTVVRHGAHLRVIGKGRKERCTPFAKSTTADLRSWLKEPQRGGQGILFPSARGERLSVHGVQYLLNKNRQSASTMCPSLNGKRGTVHRLRHTMAMDLLQAAGVDLAVIALWLGHESVETTDISKRSWR
ncbi:tyrosine-type recombinase/integrase [Rhizobium grahamii]|uniref:tyrosine-type recombinase/integrase n=1 Tax=Rhizobium grahamii TaxID=1120045 RepID=UPI001FD28B97|nr:tyrosine-type recombinase/integrase [Rhizobium grahamii]